ncbi:MAG: flagellar basal-body rod protein FlgG [Proteobacteria bacterium]|jgi:flagellar basal-body rod protein FlgG|nr:flagellar basal-body rod protein FlgG [Pseudomonadota bacterium]
MERALNTAATGMQAQQTNIDIISNNLANINTTAYKKAQAHFSTLFSQVLTAPGAVLSDGRTSPNGVQVGLGVELSSTDKSFGMGSLNNTNDPLDVAIEGEGFLQVVNPDGNIVYTRDGNLQIDGQTGELLSSQGYGLFPSINLGNNVQEIRMQRDGTISVVRGGSAEEEVVGNLRIAKFTNNAGLMELSQNLYKETNASGNPQEGSPGESGFGSIRQKFLELSNVKVVEEVVNMITAQRAYEANSNAIKASSEMLQQANNLVN